MRQLWKAIKFSFDGAGFLVGSAIGAASIAAWVARAHGLELPEFPATVVGLYENFRAIAFFWTPDWWPVWVSDSLNAYIALSFSIYRGIGLSESIFEPDERVGLTTKVFASLLGFWTITFPLVIGGFLLFSDQFKKDAYYLFTMLFSTYLTLGLAAMLIFYEYIQNLAGF